MHCSPLEQSTVCLLTPFYLVSRLHLLLYVPTPILQLRHPLPPLTLHFTIHMNPDDPPQDPPPAAPPPTQATQNPLQPLAGALPADAFQTLHSVLSSFDQRMGSLDQRVSSVEQDVVTAQQMRGFVQTAFSNTQFVVNPSTGTHSTTPSARMNPPKITLQPFSGRANENVRGWLSTIEDSLHESLVPRDNWTYYVAPMLQDSAQHWYHARKAANNDQAPRWDTLRAALIEHFDPPARIDELHQQTLGCATNPW